ncbi:MAG TPA: SH3 domain-containing protein, partial [Anaerolineales bacterium]|nr:SH3 domain-containing protein [Anaerolineales bacterium]
SPTPTNTATPTATPTHTPTLTPVPPTPTPTPVLAVVNVPGFDGARIRTEPLGSTIAVIANGTVVQILPDSTTVNGVLWYHVITPDGIEGWIVGQLLDIVTVTPAP